jgi:hypothetical protein
VAAGVAALYLGLALLNAWPIPLRVTSHLPHDLGDPVVSLTLLQWNMEVPLFSSRWWNGVGFYPLEKTITLSDPRLGLSLAGAPVLWLTGSAVAMYNVLFILSFALSAMAMHALVFSLTRSHGAAVVAGCAYGFAPFRAAHLAHLELLASYWMPIALLALHRWLDEPRARWLLLLGISLAAQGLFCAYYLPMFAVLLGAWLLWFAVGRVPAPQLAAVLGVALLGAAVLLPLFLQYREAHQALAFTRGLGEIELYSADVEGLWAIAPELRLWPSIEARNAEGYLFPGLVIVLLVLWAVWSRRTATHATRGIRRLRATLLVAAAVIAVLALIALVHGPIRVTLAGLTLSLTHLRKPASLMIASLVAYGLLHPRVIAAARTRSVLAFYALCACLMFTLALGPSPTLLGVKFLYKPPYAWLMELPGFDESLRAPARFGMLAALALSVAAGVACRQLLSVLSPAPGRWTAAVLAMIVLAEGWTGPSVSHPIPARFQWPHRCAALPRLELPFRDIEHDAAAQYRAMLDGARSVNGTTGFVPPHMLALDQSIDARDPGALAAVAEYGPVCVAVDASEQHGPELSRWVATHPLADRLGSALPHHFYVLRRASPADDETTGEMVPIASAHASTGQVELRAITDGRPGTAWITPTSQRGDAELVVSLGCRAQVDTLAVSQGAYSPNFARELAIDVSADGSSWRSVWRGPTGGRTVSAALKNARLVTTYFPVETRDIRHLRLRARRKVKDAPWAIADLAALGLCSDTRR